MEASEGAVTISISWVGEEKIEAHPHKESRPEVERAVKNVRLNIVILPLFLSCPRTGEDSEIRRRALGRHQHGIPV